MNRLNDTNRKLVLATAIAWALQLVYFVMPIDLIPDFIPLVGWFDDLFGLSSAIGLTAYTLKSLSDAGAFAQVGHRPAPPLQDVYEPIPDLELKRL